jgi:hypothetical protein
MTNLAENRYLQIGVILLATWLVYFPGLDSLFLFDDGPNLSALAHIQGASLFSPDFWEFVFAGEAGPTGRPVSLFTFALQANAWPDNPETVSWWVVSGLGQPAAARSRSSAVTALPSA